MSQKGTSQKCHKEVKMKEEIEKIRGNAVNEIEVAKDEKELEQYIKSKKSAPHIIRISGVKSTEKFYSAFDIFAMTSLYEGLPVVAIEAQASGIPTILSKNIDPSVIYSDKVNLLPIDKGSKPWVREFVSWKNKDFDRNFKGNSNYNINVQYQKLFDWYSSWLKKYK